MKSNISTEPKTRDTATFVWHGAPLLLILKVDFESFPRCTDHHGVHKVEIQFNWKKQMWA